MEGFFEHDLWAITDDEGGLLDVIQGSVHEAERAAQRGFDGEVWIDAFDDAPDAYEPEQRLAANEVRHLPGLPGKALRIASATKKFPKFRALDMDEVMAMSVAKAHELVRTFMPTERVLKDGRHTPVNVWQKVDADFYEAMLSSNYKLMKGALKEKEISLSRGLNLLPHAIAFWSDDDREAYFAGEIAAPSISPTLCAHSNPFCRKTCLVYSGQNAVDYYALSVKLAKVKALLTEPVAFCRLLVPSIKWHEHAIRRHDEQPYVRFNLLTDIPWELFLPGLMETFPGVQFYDYTKVPGRFDKIPENYDLTFSFSGTNLKECKQEAARGRRIATVFFNKKWGQYRKWLPKEWMGMPVVDGDKNDLRPTDPPGAVVVGLTYKPPAGGTKHSAQMRAAGPPPKFVVACFEEEGELMTAETPRQSNAGDYEDIAPAAE